MHSGRNKDEERDREKEGRKDRAEGLSEDKNVSLLLLLLFFGL